MADTPFARALKAAIAKDGPMRLDRYMGACNAHYYATRDPFGQRGDFTTAPEIFQGFGECLGLWAASVWESMGRPAPVLLAELGPGRGTLMADALRAIARAAPAFRAALAVHFVETSPVLKAAQLAAVPEARFHDTIDELPPGPAIVLANEFLDALPVRQFVRRLSGWAEMFLDAALSPAELPTHETGLGQAPPGTWLEAASAARGMVASLAGRLAQWGGVLLVVDYGYVGAPTRRTLQAVRAHRPADPFADPGEADLTAHVDFASLSAIARDRGAAAHGPVAQGAFLTGLGLLHRAEQLAALNPQEATSLRQAAHRLVAPSQMGALFKVMAICHPSLPTPPGFP